MISRTFRKTVVSCLVFACIVSGQSGNLTSPQAASSADTAKPEREEGIPVTDLLVMAKCGKCHVRDEQGNMERISWERTTPEGWQDVLKRMVVVNGASLTPGEGRSIVKYLSTYHGLAPDEAKPLMYDVERRVHDESGIASENLRNACAKCHAMARPLSWRRSVEEWKQLADTHATRYKVTAGDEVIAFLAKAAALHTPEWNAWNARRNMPSLAGRWLVTASIPGRDKYYGEMQVEMTGDDEFNTSVRLTSIHGDGPNIVRTGRSVVYGANAWRGRSKGEPASTAPDDPASEAREVLWIASDQSSAEGRWFWGQYQEFGFDVKLRRASTEPTLLLLDRASLKAGSEANRIRLIGDRFPAQVKPSDLDFGSGVGVRRIVSSTSSEIIAEVNVSSNAPTGKRNVSFRRSVVPGAIAIYDVVDYVKVTPESAMAAFGDRARTRGYEQFAAIGFQRGPDGKPHTADDLELGPVDVIWSIEVFYAAEGKSTEFVGKVSPMGLFTPAVDSPNNNFDVWVVATAATEKDKNGKPLVGKSYMVVTVPMYVFNGRRYIRDLDRWIDDGPAQAR